MFVKHAVAVSMLGLSVALRLYAAGLGIASNPQPKHLPPHSAVVTAKAALRGSGNSCTMLPIDRPQKRILLRQSACFQLEVEPGEATQLLLDQPEDLTMHLTGNLEAGKPNIRDVDSFDLGIETLTINEPGAYRVEVGRVKPSRRALTFSIVRWKLEAPRASAWQQAEAWATLSKQSGKTEDLDRSLALWQDVGDASSIARTYLKRGSVLERDPYNNWPAARDAFERAVALCGPIFDARCSAEGENNSGLMSSRLGDFNAATLRLEEASRDWEKIGDKERWGAVLSNLGLMLWQASDYSQAISSLNQAETLLRTRNPVRYAQDLTNLGLYYQSLGEYRRARHYFHEAARLFEDNKDLPNSITARVNLGGNYMLEGNLPRAQSLLTLTLEQANRLAYRRIRAHALSNLGQSLWSAGKLPEAQSRLELALEANREIGSRSGESSALYYLGLIAKGKGDIAMARGLLEQSAQIRMDVGLRDDASETLFSLADLEYYAGLPQAREHAEKALALLESVRSQVPGPALRASYFARKRKVFDLLVDMAMSPENPNADKDGLLAVERGRGRSLIDWLASGALSGPIPDDLLSLRAANLRELDYVSFLLARTPPGKDADLRVHFQKLLDDRADIDARIQTALAGQKIAQPLQSLEELQAELLRDDCALLEYSLGAKRSFLWVVDGHRVQKFTLKPAAGIDSVASSIVHEFGEIVERKRSDARRNAFRASLKSLSTMLLGPLSSIQLPKRLILVPDGILHQVPFAALELPHRRGTLGLVHDLVQAPSAAYLLAGARPRPISQFPKTVLAVADPVYPSYSFYPLANAPQASGQGSSAANISRGWSRLVFAGEIGTIESLVPASRRRVLRRYAASRESLGHLRLEDFGVLHFSTHALIDNEIPELSGIVLSMVDRSGHPVDGFLHPYQLAQMHLAGSTVVLSACNTALGRRVSGEGIM